MLISFLICYFSLGKISSYIATLKFEKKYSLCMYVCCKFSFFVSKFGKRVDLVLFLISFNLSLFTA